MGGLIFSANLWEYLLTPKSKFFHILFSMYYIPVFVFYSHSWRVFCHLKAFSIDIWDSARSFIYLHGLAYEFDISWVNLFTQHYDFWEGFIRHTNIHIRRQPRNKFIFNMIFSDIERILPSNYNMSIQGTLCS